VRTPLIPHRRACSYMYTACAFLCMLIIAQRVRHGSHQDTSSPRATGAQSQLRTLLTESHCQFASGTGRIAYGRSVSYSAAGATAAAAAQPPSPFMTPHRLTFGASQSPASAALYRPRALAESTQRCTDRGPDSVVRSGARSSRSGVQAAQPRQAQAQQQHRVSAGAPSQGDLLRLRRYAATVGRR
jgi:hypothetical protein